MDYIYQRFSQDAGLWTTLQSWRVTSHTNGINSKYMSQIIVGRIHGLEPKSEIRTALLTTILINVVEEFMLPLSVILNSDWFGMILFLTLVIVGFISQQNLITEFLFLYLQETVLRQ